MAHDHAAQTTTEEAAAARAPGTTGTSGGLGPLTALQQQVGNRAFAGMVGKVVQRHPVGAALPDAGALVADVGDTTKKSASATKPVAAGGATHAPPSATQAERDAATQSGTAYTGELATAGHGRAMSLAGAQSILTGAFGDIHAIVPGTIQILNGRAALWAKYDEVCIAGGVINPDTGVAWVAGDAQVASPGLEGFAWLDIVYVNADTPLVTATAHEMLHNNTGAGFRSAMGESVNEGCTEYLAKKALNAAGVATPAGSSAYPDQVEIVTRLIAFTNEASMIAAYFNGPDGLVLAYETARNERGSWPAFKTAADSLDLTQVAPLLSRVAQAGETDLVTSHPETAVV
jgi:hypothetical protein